MKTKIFPVIHHLDAATTLDQAELCVEAGVDGVFLISHRGANHELLQMVEQVREAHPKLLIGLNLLGASNALALGLAVGGRADMLWLDAPGVTGQGLDENAVWLRDKAALCGPGGPQIFASVAFKYQPNESDPAGAAHHAANNGFIPTTSGPGTGQAPVLEKIKAMHRPGGQLAIASGMTPDNVAAFAPYLSHILVATGVSSDEHRFDFEAMVRFVANVRAAQSVDF